MEIPLSLFCRVKNSRSGDIFAAGVLINLGIVVLVGTGIAVLIVLGIAVLVGTGTGVLVGSGIAVLVGISAGVLTGLGIAVLVGTGIVVLVTSVIEVVGLLELTESTNWGELVLVSCVHAANNKRYIVVININLKIIKYYFILDSKLNTNSRQCVNCVSIFYLV